jgi:PhnB protein
MRITNHLCFNGNCEAAFRFYERLLGGRIQTLQTYGESPLAEQTPAHLRNRIIHATLNLGTQDLFGADVMPEDFEQPAGFFIALNVGDIERARTVFAALSEGGEVRMPFAQTYWSRGFGIVIDRFGTPWEISG